MTQVNFVLLKSKRFTSCLRIVKATTDKKAQRALALGERLPRVGVSIISIAALAVATRCV